VRLPRSLEALRERDLALYASASGISMFGTGMANVALAFAVLELGGATDLGLVLLAREIPMVVLLLAGGIWADRLPRKLILAGCDALSAASQGATALLLLTGDASVARIAALQIVYGSARAFSRPATTGLVQQIAPAERLQDANALVGLARSVGRVAGPGVGGLLVTAIGPAWALAGDAATFAVSALLVLSLHVVAVPRGKVQSALADLREGWQEVRSRSWLWTIIVYFGLYQLLLFPSLLVLGPLVAAEDLGGAKAWGAILAFQAIGSLAGGVLALRIRFDRPLVATILLAMGLPWLLYLLAVPAPLAVLAGFTLVASACLTIDDAVWSATLQRHIPEHAISRVSSFDWFGSVALNPLGYLLVGPLSDAIGVTETLVLAATANTAAALVVLLVPAVRGLGAYPAGVAAGSSR
jgi:MFS family permease